MLCRASVHSFHRLSILERATDHECNNNCNRPIEMWVGFKCNGLIVFSQTGGASKVYNTCAAFPPIPLPPCLPHLLSLVPSPLSPHPPSSVVVGRDIFWLWCSDRGVLSKEGWSVNCDRAIVIFDGSEPWENSAGAQESGDDQQRPRPLPQLPWCPWLGTWRQGGGGGG
jgi:hypothetical protein